MITFDRVSKLYADGTPAVSELTLEIPSGKITVLVGPSGCGKTTTLRLINRMIEPSRGRISIDGQDITTIHRPALRRGIGYVIQQSGLFPNKTVADNIATVPRLLGRSRRDARAQASALMEKVGLDPALGERYPSQLSGGQQQRAGVARALAADPPILLMDEPFSAIDPIVRSQLQAELLTLQQDLAKTIVFVTHDIDEAVKLGDKIAVMQVGGMLSQVGSPADILARPADAFVASFVGRDRGYRALGFAYVANLPLAGETPVREGDSFRLARDRSRNGWTLVLDATDTPRGWVAPDTLAEADLDMPIGQDMINLGGTLARRDGTLRETLDAALSSPSGRGVVIDNAGRLAGTVTASEVLQAIELRRSTERSPRIDAPAAPAQVTHVRPAR